MANKFGVTSDYDYDATHKRSRIVVWSGRFFETAEAEGFSLPNGTGYMLTTYNGDKVRVSCPIRTDATYREVDAAISAALTEHYAKRGAVQLASN